MSARYMQLTELRKQDIAECADDALSLMHMCNCSSAFSCMFNWTLRFQIAKSFGGLAKGGEPSQGRGPCEGWICKDLLTPCHSVRHHLRSSTATKRFAHTDPTPRPSPLSASPTNTSPSMAAPSPPALQHVLAFTRSTDFVDLCCLMEEAKETGGGDAMSREQAAEEAQNNPTTKAKHVPMTQDPYVQG